MGLGGGTGIGDSKAAVPEAVLGDQENLCWQSPGLNACVPAAYWRVVFLENKNAFFSKICCL